MLHQQELRMTTTVTVKTHDWPVRVSGFAMSDGEPVPGAQYEERGTVPPRSEREFVCHAQMDLLIQELPLPAEPAPSTISA